MAERFSMQKALLESPEYKARQAARDAERRARQVEAERQRDALRKSKLWWASLVVWPAVCVPAMLFIATGVQVLFRWIGQTWHWQPPSFNRPLLISGALVWGITYAISAGVNSCRWWHAFTAPFLPYAVMVDAFDFLERVGPLLASFPVNFIVVFASAHGLAEAISLVLLRFGLTSTPHASAYYGVM